MREPSTALHVLALNPGSSSLRFQVVDVRREGAGWLACRLGGGGIAGLAGQGEGRGRATLRARLAGTEAEFLAVDVQGHAAGLERALQWLQDKGLGFETAAVRVVHGGGSREAARAVDADLLARLARFRELAPLHDGPALALIEELRRKAGVRVFAAFDSAFFAELPEVARTYGLPRDLALRHGVRRIGFHGFALTSVLEKQRGVHGADGGALRMVVAHLGGGASVTAVRDGRPVDTSMGFTPLEGLVMGTRCGDLDPALVPWLARAEGCSAELILERLNRDSGLLGLSGVSGDMREIERLRAAGDPRASLAFGVFVHRARRHIAAAMASLGGADLLVFSGGIGENSPLVRATITDSLAWCGVRLDPQRNAEGGLEATISTEDSPVRVQVIGVDEESPMARAAARAALAD